MDIKTLTHREGAGWSCALPTELDGPNTLVIVFGAASYIDSPAALTELMAAFPCSKVIGCSSAGEIHADLVADDTLVVGVARFEHTTVAYATAPIAVMGDSAQAGTRIGAELAAIHPRFVLALSDGLRVNGSELVKGLTRTLPPDTIISGGLAGDGDRFARTWVIVDGQPRSGYVTAVALSGAVEVTTGSKGGWDIFGPERRVTRSEGNVLYELDGKPALALYKTYLGELAKGLPATALLFPLAIRDGVEDNQAVVRTVLAVDETAQSMTFAGDVPQGWRARLMRATDDRLIEGAASAAASAMVGGSSDPVLSLAISCVGRRLVLGQRVEEETEAVLHALPGGSQQIGFYSYGEISPNGLSGCDLHNQTMTLTTLREVVA
ncbi:MAG TPA: FIST N-terminal domain-containing protein [Casimicrobiaceae bacterium]|jgi:hypothetical protein|nr:FIST N-terminal domain-containing protein [Casimicrobiaceae bacterium]